MLENCNSYIIPLYCSHISQYHMPFSGTAIRNHKRSLCYSWTYVTSWTGFCGFFQADNTLNVYWRATLSNLSRIIAVFNPPINKSRAWNMLWLHCSKPGKYNSPLLAYRQRKPATNYIQAFKAVHCSWGGEFLPVDVSTCLSFVYQQWWNCQLMP